MTTIPPGLIKSKKAGEQSPAFSFAVGWGRCCLETEKNGRILIVCKSLSLLASPHPAPFTRGPKILMPISLPCVKGGGNAAGIDGGIVGCDAHIAPFLSPLSIYNRKMLIYYE